MRVFTALLLPIVHAVPAGLSEHAHGPHPVMAAHQLYRTLDTGGVVPKRAATLSVTAAADSVRETFNVSFESSPFETRYGEVLDSIPETLQWPAELVARYADPKRQAALIGYGYHVVRIGDDGVETRVPLHELYTHHGKIEGLPEPVAQIRFGIVDRLVPTLTDAPYQQVLSEIPAEFQFQFMVMNTHRPGAAFDGKSSPLHMCPCTPQRVFDFEKSTIDGQPFDGCEPGQKSHPLAATNNSVCSMQTYSGGHLCCVSGKFIIDTDTECASPDCTGLPVERFYYKVWVSFEDAKPETIQTSLSMATIPGYDYIADACPIGTPPSDCTYTLDMEVPTSLMSASPQRLIMTRPHVHVHALSIELRDATTNMTLCHRSRANGGLVYGTGAEWGNEAGYIVNIVPCTFGADGLIVYPLQKFRIIATVEAPSANAKTQHNTGMMGQFLMYTADLPSSGRIAS